MTMSAIATCDVISGNPVTTIDDANVQWSSTNNWLDVTVEQYKLPDVNTPEFATTDHILAIHLSRPALIEVTIDGERHSDIHRRGDMSLFPAGIARQLSSKEPHEVLVVAIAPKVLHKIAFESRQHPARTLVEKAWFRDPQCEYIGRAFKAEAETNYLSGQLYGDSLALALAARLLKYHSASSDPVLECKGGMAPRVLRRVLDYIQDNLDGELRMRTLASIAGLSQYRFAHNFKTATGLAPHQYVIRARVERGKQMLRETDSSILEIAHAVGCQSATRFSSLFRRATGMTPSTYRASIRQLHPPSCSRLWQQTDVCDKKRRDGI